MNILKDLSCTLNSSKKIQETERKFSTFVRRHQLFNTDDKLLVGVSGGADSIALMLLLRAFGTSVEAVHCNFQLRGEEADRDEDFCREFCRKNAIPLHVTSFGTRQYAKEHKISIEMAARELRYAYFERLRVAVGAAAICVAHHQDDQVETILMNLVRGTGISGLAGMKVKNGRICRPMLCLTREEIVNYLAEKRQDFVTDSSNLDECFLRNKIRLKLIPLLQELNPKAGENIFQSSLFCKDFVDDYNAMLNRRLQDFIKVEDGKVFLPFSLFESESMLYFFLQKYGFSPRQIQLLHDHKKEGSGKLFLSDSHRLLVDRNQYILEKIEESVEDCLEISGSGEFTYVDGLRFSVDLFSVDETFAVEKNSGVACLDADSFEMPLWVRRVRRGDRFQPFGMRGTQLVSDYLTNQKKDLFSKSRQLVMTDASGRILWLVGERTSELCRVTAHTRRVLMVKMKETGC